MQRLCEPNEVLRRSNAVFRVQVNRLWRLGGARGEEWQIRTCQQMSYTIYLTSSSLLYGDEYHSIVFPGSHDVPLSLLIPLSAAVLSSLLSVHKCAPTGDKRQEAIAGRISNLK